MSGTKTIDCKPANLLKSMAVLFILIIQCGAQSQDQAGTDQKATGKDEIIACRFSALGMSVDIEVKDQRGKIFPGLNWKNLIVYEDGVEQQILAFMQTGEQSSGNYSLYYEPMNMVFDGKRRKVRIEARTNDGRKLRVNTWLRPDPNKELRFNIGVYPQSYSIEELPREK